MISGHGIAYSWISPLFFSTVFGPMPLTLVRSAAMVRDAVLSWVDVFTVGDSTWTAMESAFDLVTDHGLQIWDALILSVAAEQKCRLLLSEDFQNGFTWCGVTVTNPFAETRHPLLKAVIES